MITPLPGATPLVPGSCTLPLPGIMAAIVDETGRDVPNGRAGCWWSSRVAVDDPHHLGRPERFRKSYYPAELGGKLYLAGDGSIRDKETGYFTIVGRIDDVLNVSGHRMGTMEIESALVANAAGGRGRRGRPSRRDHRRSHLRLRRAEAGAADRRGGAEAGAGTARLGRQGDRRDCQAEGHPLRRQPAEDAQRQDHARLLRSIAKGEEIAQDVSTLENPAILDQLKVTL